MGSNFDQEIAQCKAAAQRFYGNLGQHPRPRDGERSNASGTGLAKSAKLAKPAPMRAGLPRELPIRRLVIGAAVLD